jgi:hypothetical protein
MSDLHILIPSLLSPLLLWQKDFLFTPKSALLSTLLVNSQRDRHALKGVERNLFALLGWQAGQELPIAYYRYQLDFASVPDSALMCADPVHLQAGVDEIMLSPEQIDDLSNADTEELITCLNQHFEQDNWQFIYAESGHCYLKYQGGEAIQTTPLDYVRGKSIFKYLPQSDNLNWHRLQNEIQMLLHMTSLNQSREMAQQQSINSLWFWGAGQVGDDLHTPLPHSIKSIWGGGSNAKIAAKAAAIPHQALPQHYDALQNGQHIVLLDTLYQPALQDQYSQWQAALDDLEHNTLAPLIKWAKQKGKSVSIHDCDGQTFVLQYKRQWKFWQKSTLQLQDLCATV